VFLEFVAHTILNWSDRDGLDRAEKRMLDKRETELRDREVTKHAGLTIPLWFLQPDLANDVTTTIKAIDNYSDAIGEFRRIMDLFGSHGKQLMLIFDDTDTWTRTAKSDRHEIAAAFFSGPFRALVKDAEIPSVLAIHPSYVDLTEYRAVRQYLDTVIEIPRFDDQPAAALSAILERRVRTVIGDAVQLGQVVMPDAVEALGTFYSGPDQHNLRDTLRTANTALEHASRNDAEIVSVEMVEMAIAEELG